MGQVPLTYKKNLAFQRSFSIFSTNHIRAINSVGECHLHTVEVTGSNPVSPTQKEIGILIFFKNLF